MIIIAEKINGAIPATAKAIAERDEEYIRNLAVSQVDAGADYLDVCAGTSPQEEYDALCWLLDVVQEATDVPICLDSPDPNMILKTIDRVRKPGIINSISAEQGKCETLLPALREMPEWQVVALCSSNAGVATTAEEKIEIASGLLTEVEAAGIDESRVFLDPLVLAASAAEGGGLEFCRAIPMIKERWPNIKVTAAVSNISYGSPARGLMNHVFLAMTLACGLDAGIVDPLNRDILGTIYSVNALTGADAHSRKYNKAFRTGVIGPKKS